MGSCLRFLVVIVCLFSLVSVFVPWVGAVDGGAASLAVAEAEEALVSAYGAVLVAEEAGADVSGLLVRLNVAAGYLAEAIVFVGLGDYEGAVRLAGLCVEAVDGVEGEAVLLRGEAARRGMEDVLVRVFGSVVGVVVVAVGGFVLWGVFKRRYVGKVLGSRPEVVSDES